MNTPVINDISVPLINALIGYFIGPIGGLIGMNLEFQDAKIASDRLFEIMDLEVEDEDHKIRIGDEQVGDISFENVSFSYGTRAKIFESFDLHIKKGTYIFGICTLCFYVCLSKALFAPSSL